MPAQEPSAGWPRRARVRAAVKIASAPLLASVAEYVVARIDRSGSPPKSAFTGHVQINWHDGTSTGTTRK
jgi:hypothetical protein